MNDKEHEDTLLQTLKYVGYSIVVGGIVVLGILILIL